MKKQVSRIQRSSSGMIMAVLILSALAVTVQAAEIHGKVWNDANRNGAPDTGEVGIPDIQVCYSGFKVGENTTLTGCSGTGTDGSYSFLSLEAAQYVLREDVPLGYMQSWPNVDGNYYLYVTLASDTVANDQDFGMYQLIPPPADVSIPQSSGTLGGVPTVLRPGLWILTVKKDLSTSVYPVLAVSLEVTWDNLGNPVTETLEMTQVGTTGVWTVDVPAPLPGNIYPSGDALMTFSVHVDPSTQDFTEVGDIIFLDPSGQILDGCTNQPLTGAIVTLYLYDPTTKSSIPCPSVNIWPHTTPNTLITGSDGRYFWDTSGGSYQVGAQMAGYETEMSSIVSVPPPVTGLDITLIPIGGCSGTSPVHPLTISLQQIQIYPHGAEKVQIQGKFTLEGQSEGIDPVTDRLGLRLFLPTGLPGSGQFYPAGSDAMPVMFQAMNGGWTMTQSERARTGLQDFVIMETSDPGTFTFRLVDTQAGIANQDYSRIQMEISSGSYAGIADIDLVGNNGKFTL